MHKQQLMKGISDRVGWPGFQRNLSSKSISTEVVQSWKIIFNLSLMIVLWISIQTIQKYIVKINSLDHIGHHSKSGNTILRPVGILKNKRCVCRSPKYKTNSAKIQDFLIECFPTIELAIHVHVYSWMDNSKLSSP